ncbi:hypothetical protein ACGFIV_32530 [Sphaerisporangium sp. NPDC049003]|uniref:deazapurine DNA modification protein DpdA family protein n=1 Tax=Sphaerisporangium sp. NPDC049003 TaxID=3364517 RepID=UPI003715CE45
MRFFLGTHHPDWLARVRVPLYVSQHALSPLSSLPRLAGGGVWGLDSGAYTELTRYGRWRLGARAYARMVRRYHDEIGPPRHIAQLDWPCEDQSLASTGLSVAEHQRATIINGLELRSLEPDLPWMLVLQGRRPRDYLDHLEQWLAAGIDLREEPVVGLGSICRKGNTLPVALMISRLARLGLRLHTFGYKTTGLISCAGDIVSSDSLAWSRAARWEARHPRHPHGHCGNCIDYALAWRAELLERVNRAHPGVVEDLLPLNHTA